MPEVELRHGVRVLKSATGDLREVPVESALEEAGKNNETFATLPEIEEHNKRERYGSTGALVQGAGESVVRAATGGAIPGFDLNDEAIRARKGELERQAPVTAFAAEAAGALAPTLLGGGALRAVGAGGALVGIGEGLAGGLATEAGNAKVEGRPISADSIALAGAGGLLFGHVLPGVLRGAASRVAGGAGDAAAVVTGDATESLAPKLEQAATARAAQDVVHLPPGPERDALLVQHADKITADASQQAADIVNSAPSQLAASDLTKRDLKALMPADSPAQTRWATDVAEELRGHAEVIPPEPAAPAESGVRETAPPAAAATEGTIPIVEPAAEAEGAAGRTIPPASGEPASTVRRTAKGARIADGIEMSGGKPTGAGSPLDLSDWSLDDFRAGKGRSKVATMSAYGGAERLGKYQRGLVDELVSNPEFAQTGKVADFKNQPTFEVKPDSTIELHNGKTRMIAARELGRPDIYGRVVIRHGGREQVVFEGMIPIGKGPQRAVAQAEDFGAGLGQRGAAPAAPPYADALRQASASMLESKGGLDTLVRAREALGQLRAAGAPAEAIASLERGVADQSLWGRAGEAVADFDRSGKIGAKATAGEVATALEDRAAARAKWLAESGSDRVPKRLLRTAERAKSAVSIADDVAAAKDRVGTGTAPTPVASPAVPAEGEASSHGAALSALGEAVQHKAIHAGVHLLAHGVPGLGAGLAAARMGWHLVDAAGRASVKAAARKLALGALTGSAQALEGAGGPLAASATQVFAGDYSSPREAYEARKGTLLEMARNPSALPHAMAASFGDLAKEHPQAYMDLAARMGRAQAYVTQNLPPGVAVSLLHPGGLPPSSDALREFATVWNSTMHPQTVVDDVAAGKATPAQIKALHTVDPQLYQSLLSAVTTEVGQNYSQIPAQTKQWLDILFQSDGIAGPAFSWRAAQAIQESLAQPGQPASSAQMASKDAKQPLQPNARGLDKIASSVTNRSGG
jgi:hypothetical protein